MEIGSEDHFALRYILLDVEGYTRCVGTYALKICLIVSKLIENLSGFSEAGVLKAEGDRIYICDQLVDLLLLGSQAFTIPSENTQLTR